MRLSSRPLLALLIGACGTDGGVVRDAVDGGSSADLPGMGQTVAPLLPPGVDLWGSAPAGPESDDDGGWHDDDGEPAGDTGDGDDERPNLLLVVADDMGMESFVCDDRFPDVQRGEQPTLRGLCDQGVTFTQAWSYPVCSPTRAAMTTGRQAWRTGMGEAVGNRNDPLDPDELTLPQAFDLADVGYTHALIGKWHLSLEPGDPNLYGWDHFAGALDGEVEDFYDWTRIVDGVSAQESGYATTVNVDDALDWIDDQDGPWLLWLAFNAPHKPLHLPPSDLHSFDDLTGTAEDIAARPERYHMAMIEAMDTELGRLIAGIPDDEIDRTWIVFVSDNGSTANVAQGAWPGDQAKGTLTEGGVLVPLVVMGPGVGDPGRAVSQPVQVADLYATLLDLAGIDPLIGRSHMSELDGSSLLPLVQDREEVLARDVVMTGLFGSRTTSDREGLAARDDRYRLMVYENGRTVLTDMQADPHGTVNLLDGSTLSLTAQAHHDRLADAIDDAREHSRYIEW